MAKPQTIFDLNSLDLNFDEPLFDVDGIAEVNPQRYEMAQLTGIVHIDEERQGLVGFKDISNEEFWVRGHMPDFALMPGVIMCEAAAQLGGFYARKFNILKGDFLGFGGMDEIRFRAPVLPGQRLVLMAKVDRIRLGGRRVEFDFQGFVGEQLVVSGKVIGVPINKD